MVSLKEAIDNAPAWATHISVSKRTGMAEYYNTIGADNTSACIKKDGTIGDISPMGGDIGEGFVARLIKGDTEWTLVPIAFDLENE